MTKEMFIREPYLLDSNASDWAEPEEIKQASTIKKIHCSQKQTDAAGLPIISDGYTTYVDNSDSHTLIFGSTGSKKTRLFAMPLLNIFALAGESFVVADPKGELYQKTSGFVSKKGYDTIVLNFRDMEQSDQWNPLQIPYELYHAGDTEKAMEMINDLLTVLAEPQRRQTKDVYFIDLAYGITLAYMLFFIETATKEEANIASFLNFFIEYTTPEHTQTIVQLMTPGSIAHLNLKGVLTTVAAEKTFGNIISTAVAMFSLFTMQRSLCKLISNNSCDITKIGKQKTAVYLIVPDEKNTLHTLVTIFVKQSYEIVIAEAQKEKNRQLPVRLNFLLDEFGNMPTIPDMPSMITAARSRNIRFFLMGQGIYQINNKYKGEVETFIGNCDNLVFLSSKEPELLRKFSELCGTKTDGNPLISVGGLQKLQKGWDKSEVLILHSRNLPFVSVLPDIDWYGFKTEKPIERQNKELPQITRYDYKTIKSKICDGYEPIAFSMEVHGEHRYLKAKPEKPKDKKDLYEW